MKPSPSPDPLAALLSEWRVHPLPDPHFRAAVWQRLAQRTRQTWPAYLRSHALAWSAACVVAVVAAGWTGHRVAQVKLAEQREQMVVAYLGNLDPRVLARTTPPP